MLQQGEWKVHEQIVTFLHPHVQYHCPAMLRKCITYCSSEALIVEFPYHTVQSKLQAKGSLASSEGLCQPSQICPFEVISMPA